MKVKKKGNNWYYIIIMFDNDLLMAKICSGKPMYVCVYTHKHISTVCVHAYKCKDCNWRYNCIKQNTVSKYLKLDFTRTMFVQMKWIMCSNYEVKSLLHYVPSVNKSHNVHSIVQLKTMYEKDSPVLMK